MSTPPASQSRALIRGNTFWRGWSATAVTISPSRAGAITAAFAASTGGFGRVPLTPLEELQRRVMALDRETFRQFFVWFMTDAAKRHR